MLDFLNKLGENSDYITVYLTPNSFPHGLTHTLSGHGNVSEQLQEAVSTDAVLRESDRYGTGAIIIWSQTGNKDIIIPPFTVTEERVLYGSPQLSPLRQLLEKERTFGLVLLNWGSYALGIMRSDPKIIRVARLPNLSTNRPANGASTIEAKMIIEEIPPAVRNMWRKLLKIW